MSSLPPFVGPHEGIELELIAQNRKNVAYFCDVWPSNLDDFARAHDCDIMIFESADGSVESRSLYRKSHLREAERLQYLLQNCINGLFRKSKAEILKVELEIDQILGYAPQDTYDWVGWIMKRHGHEEA